MTKQDKSQSKPAPAKPAPPPPALPDPSRIVERSNNGETTEKR